MMKKQKDDKIMTNNLSSNKSMNVSLMISLFFLFKYNSQILLVRLVYLH